MPITTVPEASEGTALELAAAIIAEAGYGTPAVDLFLTRDPGTVDAGLVTVVQEGDGLPALTFGTPVAVEVNAITIVVYGDPEDYQTPNRRARTLRHLLTAQAGYEHLGARLLAATPRGSVLPLGRDSLHRELFSTTLDLAWETL